MRADPASIVQYRSNAGGAGGDWRCLVIANGVQRALTNATPGATTWLDSAAALTELSMKERFADAVVVDPFADMSKPDAAQLLALLRDRYARRVVVADESATFSANEYLALGYIAGDQGSALEGLYVHDPDEFFVRRDWNDARHWANPENWDRYRW